MATVAGLVALCGSPGVARAAPERKDATSGVPDSAYLAPDPTLAPEQGHYTGSSGHRLLFRPVYHEWFGKTPPRYVLRAGIEQLGILAAELGYYWLKADSNTEDWDYPDFQQRFVSFQAVRFDNNLSITNFVIHPLAGTMYYSFSRVNGLSIYESLAVSTLSSAMYEWWLEWLEKVSINDLIVTPFGGWAPGEFLFSLESYLNSAPGEGAWGNRAFQYTLGSPVYLHNQADGVLPPPPVEADSLGFSSAYYHRFSLGYGYTAVDNNLGSSSAVSDVGFGAALYKMPGFLREGSFETNFGDGNFSDVETRMSFSGYGWAGADVWFSNDFAGRYSQDIEATSNGLRGYGLLAAANTAVRYVQSSLLGRTDMWAISHLVGPHVRYWAVDGDFHADLQVSVHADFAGVQSLQYREWTNRYGAVGTKTELQNHSYYFAYGTSGRFDARLGFGGVELGGRLEVGVYDSIEGWDREQEMVTRDVHNKDQIVELSGWFQYEIPHAPIDFGIAAGETLRRSQMPPLLEKRWDRRLSLRAGVHF